MEAANVVCWGCWRLTQRLTPGTYPDGDDNEFTLTQSDISRWDALRMRERGR